MELGQGNLVSFSSSPSVSLQPKLPDPPTLMPHHDFPSRTRYLGNKQNQKMFRNLLMERVMKLEYDGLNRLLFKFFLEKALFEELCQPWKKFLVIKILGKNIS